MSFIEMPGIDDTHEPIIAPEARYPLVIESQSVKKNEKSGKNNCLIILAIEADGDYANVMFNLSLIGEEDDDASRKFKNLQMKRFCHQFDIDIQGGINTETFVGSRAEGNLAVGEYQGQKKNELKLDAMPDGA